MMMMRRAIAWALVGLASSQKKRPNKEVRLQFLHIPKNAGATIEHFFKRVRTTVDVDKCGTARWHAPPRYMHPSVYAPNKTFCVLRDPIDRYLSEYKMNHRMSRLESEKDVAAMNEHMTKQARNLVRAFDFDPEFTTIKDCHLIPQHLFVWDAEGRCTCTHLVRFENVEEDFDALMRAHGYAYRLNETKRNTHHDPTPVTVANVSTSVQRMLRHAYADDYRLLFDESNACAGRTECRPLDLQSQSCQRTAKPEVAAAAPPPCEDQVCEDPALSMPTCKRRVRVPCWLLEDPDGGNETGLLN